MRCHEIERLLTPLLDGRLEPHRRARVEQHLKGCAGCGETYALLRAAGEHLAARGPAEVPADLAERAARAAFTAEPAPAGEWLGQLVTALRWPALGTAAAAVLLAVGLLTSVPEHLAQSGAAPESVAAVLAADDELVEDDELLSDVLGQPEEE